MTLDNLETPLDSNREKTVLWYKSVCAKQAQVEDGLMIRLRINKGPPFGAATKNSL